MSGVSTGKTSFSTHNAGKRNLFGNSHSNSIAGKKSGKRYDSQIMN
jgi:hypothetical protein